MLTKSEERQLRHDDILDGLADRDDFNALPAKMLTSFLLWSDDHWTNYYDGATVDGEWVAYFDINAMFDHWLQAEMPKVA